MIKKKKNTRSVEHKYFPTAVEKERDATLVSQLVKGEWQLYSRNGTFTSLLRGPNMTEGIGCKDLCLVP